MANVKNCNCKTQRLFVIVPTQTITKILKEYSNAQCIEIFESYTQEEYSLMFVQRLRTDRRLTQHNNHKRIISRPYLVQIKAQSAKVAYLLSEQNTRLEYEALIEYDSSLCTLRPRRHRNKSRIPDSLKTKNKFGDFLICGSADRQTNTIQLDLSDNSQSGTEKKLNKQFDYFDVFGKNKILISDCGSELSKEYEEKKSLTIVRFKQCYHKPLIERVFSCFKRTYLYPYYKELMQMPREQLIAYLKRFLKDYVNYWNNKHRKDRTLEQYKTDLINRLKKKGIEQTITCRIK